MRSLILLVWAVAVTFVDARNAGSAASSRRGVLEAATIATPSSSVVRGGSAVRTPPSTALLEKTREKLKDEFANRKQPLNKKQQQQLSTTKPQSLAAAVGGTPQPSFFQQHTAAVAGILALTLLERGINKLFVQQSIEFPAQLAGCIGLFFAMILADVIRPGLGESVYSSLLPGTNLLAKWFPVLFVPGLVMLPLAPSIGNGIEVRQLLSLWLDAFLMSFTSMYLIFSSS